MLKKYEVKVSFSNNKSREDYRRGEYDYNYRTEPQIWEEKKYVVFAENERDARRLGLENINRDWPITKYIFLEAELEDFGGVVEYLWDVELKIDGMLLIQQVAGRNETSALIRALEKGAENTGVSNCVEIISVKASACYNIEPSVLTFSDTNKYKILVTLNINNEEEIVVSTISYSSLVPTEEELKYIQRDTIIRKVEPDSKNINIIDTTIQEITENISCDFDFDFDVDGDKKNYPICTPHGEYTVAYLMAIRELAKENDSSMGYQKVECVNWEAVKKRAKEIEQKRMEELIEYR
ncbi:hypothetical protein ABH955_000647 [Bacillus sp. RC240]|uniref:hypothetical protein n=1 Tax=Bacillus sp. RC240 TaxID=3156285 RepID=UPI003833979D